MLPFSPRAAIEASELIEKLKTGKQPRTTWAKVKFDIQIVSIGKAESVTAIYSDDRDIETLGSRVGIPVFRICDLPLPPTIEHKAALEEQGQFVMRLEAKEEKSETHEQREENLPEPAELRGRRIKLAESESSTESKGFQAAPEVPEEKTKPAKEGGPLEVGTGEGNRTPTAMKPSASTSANPKS